MSGGDASGASRTLSYYVEASRSTVERRIRDERVFIDIYSRFGGNCKQF